MTASYWGISETVIHFVIYEYLKKQLYLAQNKSKKDDKTFLDFAGFMLCGACSKTCATIVAYPHGKIELFLQIPNKKKTKFICRGSKNSAPRRELRLPIVLANTSHGVQERRPSRPLSRPCYPARSSDPQHGHHDVHLRADGLCLDQVAQRRPTTATNVPNAHDVENGPGRIHC